MVGFVEESQCMLLTIWEGHSLFLSGDVRSGKGYHGVGFPISGI